MPTPNRSINRGSRSSLKEKISSASHFQILKKAQDVYNLHIPKLKGYDKADTHAHSILLKQFLTETDAKKKADRCSEIYWHRCHHLAYS